MKTYSKRNEVQKRKLKYLVIILSCIAVLGLTITLIVVNGGNKSLPPTVDVIQPAPDQGTTAPPVSDDDKPTVTPPAPDVNTPVVVAPKFTTPVLEGEVTRGCSLDALVYMPSLNMYKTHNGIDYAATANTDAVAISDGKVVSVAQTTLEGTVIAIEHSGGLVSYYKSLASSAVKEGDTVKMGSVIGKAGTMLTENSDGVHVHLEMTLNGELIDPSEYVSGEIIK